MHSELPFSGDFPGTAHCLQILDAQVPFGLWVGDPAGKVHFLSPAFLELAGVRLADSSIPPWSSRLEDGEAAEAGAEWKRCRTQGAAWEREFRVRSGDGAMRHVLSRGTPRSGTGGRIKAWVGLNLDITGIRESEGEIRRLRERVLLALCAGGDFLYEADPAAGTRRWFGPMEDLLGGTAGSGSTWEKDWRERVHPADRGALDQALAEARPDHHMEYSVEYRLRRADDSVVRILDRGRRVPGGSGHPGYLIGIVSDRKDVDGEGVREGPGEEPRGGQRMEVVGRLAGGIAHDFNNLLTAINGFSELLVNVLDDEGHRAYAREILRAGERAAFTTRQLLAFSRRQILVPKVVDLNALVRDLARALPSMLGEALEVAVRTDPLGALIKADPAQVEQVLVNLASHALESRPGGGRMMVEIGRGNPAPDPGGDPLASSAGGRDQGYVQMTVLEDGEIIDEEERSHLFEPFFQGRGRKLGLGLPAVYGIVTQNGGRVSAGCRPGGGTEFRIHWPRWTGEGQAAP